MASVVYVSAVRKKMVANALLFLKRWRQSYSDVNHTICKETSPQYSIDWSLFDDINKSLASANETRGSG